MQEMQERPCGATGVGPARAFLSFHGKLRLFWRLRRWRLGGGAGGDDDGPAAPLVADLGALGEGEAGGDLGEGVGGVSAHPSDEGVCGVALLDLDGGGLAGGEAEAADEGGACHDAAGVGGGLEGCGCGGGCGGVREGGGEESLGVIGEGEAGLVRGGAEGLGEGVGEGDAQALGFALGSVPAGAGGGEGAGQNKGRAGPGLSWWVRAARQMGCQFSSG